MTNNTFDFFALAVLLIIAVALPLMGIWDFRRLLRWTEEGRADARIKTYNWAIAMEWVLALGLVGWWLLAGRDLASLGLVPVADGWQWLGIAVGVAGTILIIFQMISVLRSTKKLNEVREAMGDLGCLAPLTPEEDRRFNLVSVSAGVCEEILYRGVLMAVLAPVVGTWPAVALSSIIFGMGHAYQGLVGIGKTTLVGFVLALLAVFSGSLFIPMLLHSVVDITSGRMMGVALRIQDQKDVLKSM